MNQITDNSMIQGTVPSPSTCAQLQSCKYFSNCDDSFAWHTNGNVFERLAKHSSGESCGIGALLSRQPNEHVESNAKKIERDTICKVTSGSLATSTEPKTRTSTPTFSDESDHFRKLVNANVQRLKVQRGAQPNDKPSSECKRERESDHAMKRRSVPVPLSQHTKSTAHLKSLLYEAVKSGHKHAVLHVLHSAAQEQTLNVVNAPNLDGYTPLHRAVMNGAVGIARELLQHGAECDKLSRVGSTPLDEAVCRGSTSCVRLLVLAGARRLNIGSSPYTNKIAADLARNLVALANETQLDEVSHLLKYTPKQVEINKTHSSDCSSDSADMQFSSVPFDDIVMLQERGMRTHHILVLGDQLQRFTSTFDRRNVQLMAATSVLKNFEIIAPFFDLERVAKLHESLVHGGGDLQSADELDDEAIIIANVVKFDDAARRQLGIHTRAIKLEKYSLVR